MAIPKIFKIKESLLELHIIEKNSIPLIAKRIKALIVFKEYERVGISKRDVAEKLNINHNSINKWRKMYIYGGIEKLMEYQKPKGRHKLLSDIEHDKILQRLANKRNPIKTYKELQAFIKSEINKELKLSTLIKKYTLNIIENNPKTTFTFNELSQQSKIEFLKKNWKSKNAV